MRVLPILLNTDMVRAILDGRKTVTRRAIKNKDIVNAWDCEADGTPIAFVDQWTGDSYPPTYPCPYQPGDILYVRETWSPVLVRPKRYIYKADVERGIGEGVGLPIKWRPSIHMPKEAARLFLRVTDVRVERLQEMRLIDCLKEGVQLTIAEQGDLVIQGVRARDRFSGVWDTTIKPADLSAYGWAANPWVWVVEFERISKEAALAGKGGES